MDGTWERKMVTKPRQHRTIWTPQDITTLNELVKGNTPTRVIALKMERTPAAIQNKVSSEGMSLRPTNQKL
jgi:hypothetical protein